MVPRQSRETCRPERPRWVYSTSRPSLPPGRLSNRAFAVQPGSALSPPNRESGDRVHHEPELEPPAPPPPLKPPPNPEPPDDPELAVAANVPPAEEAKLPAPSAMLVKSGNIAPL